MRTTLTLVLGIMLAAPATLRAADPREERVYAITADGKPAGSLTLFIEGTNDGNATAKFNVSVSVRVLFKDYKYSLKGYEEWNKDQLVKLETQTNDDGKKMELKVEQAESKDKLIVTIHPKQWDLRADLWTTTYWREPSAPAGGKRLLMDADTGRLLDAKWEKVGIEALNVPVNQQQQKVNCTHWKVSGAAKAELWFDGSHRLIRQEIVESGVRMVTEIREFKK